VCHQYDNLIYEGAKNLGLSSEQFSDFLELFLEVSRKDIDSMRHSITIGDRIGAANAAHSIKGAAISLSLAPIVEAAIIAEDLARMGKLVDMREKLETIASVCDVMRVSLSRESGIADQSGEHAVPARSEQDGEL